MTRTGQKLWKQSGSTFQYGVTGAKLDCDVRPDIEVKPEAEDPTEGYETVYQEMTARAPRTG
jgi:hypothetical protein